MPDPSADARSADTRSGDALPVLSPTEVRVLGVLLEKALSTPDVYPLSLNALVSGCNQKSNRDPLVAFDDGDAEAALVRLVGRRLAAEQTGMGSRVPKYRALVGGVYELTSAEKAVLAELMLRGPQTAGELRARCERMHAFAAVDDVQAALDTLAAREAPLVAAIAGRREPRWAHLLAGDVAPDALVAADDLPTASGASTSAPATTVGALAAEVEALCTRVEALEAAFDAFRRQFE